MNTCEEYIILMNMYLDGEAEPHEEEQLFRHLDACTDCKKRFDSFRLISGAARAIPHTAPDTLHGVIMNAVAADKKARAKSRLKKRIISLGATAAMLAIIIVAATGGLGPFGTMANDSAEGRSLAPQSLGVAGDTEGTNGAATTVQATAAESLDLSQEVCLSKLSGVSDTPAEYRQQPAFSQAYGGYFLACGSAQVPGFDTSRGSIICNTLANGDVSVILEKDDDVLEYVFSVLTDTGFDVYTNVTNAPQPDGQAGHYIVLIEVN